jgi:hypothetical protein
MRSARFASSVALTLLLASACIEGYGETTSSKLPVLNGSLEPAQNYPWVVSVQAIRGCHGVLLHPQWVLTAAHCVNGSQSIVDVKAAINQEEEQSRSGFRYLHPDYSWPSVQDDIALVRLNSPFQVNRSVQTVDLPAAPVAVGQLGTVASKLDHPSVGGGGHSTPAELLTVYEAPIVEYPSQPRRFRTRHVDMALCEGDSGSGFVRVVTAADGRLRATVVGVASASTCQPDGNAGFVHVYDHLDWIVSTITDVGPELDGNVSLATSGLRAQGTLRLECGNHWAEGPMEVEGIEVALACVPGSVVSASCDLRGDRARELSRFTRADWQGSVDLAHEDDYAIDSIYYIGEVLLTAYSCGIRLPVSLIMAVL